MNETVATRPILGLDDVCRAAGVTLDAMRARMRRNPALKGLFERVSGVYVTEAAKLPLIAAELKK